MVRIGLLWKAKIVCTDRDAVHFRHIVRRLACHEGGLLVTCNRTPGTRRESSVGKVFALQAAGRIPVPASRAESRNSRVRDPVFKNKAENKQINKVES